MPVEEHKELRDLVTQTLQAKGVLQKVQAEIRASVFLALEEQDVFKEKNPFINQPLKDYLSSSEGVIAISLVKEFLEFFNLEFTAMVFGPETHAGLDYNYEGRSKLSRDLKLEANADNKVPLLGLVVKLLTSSIKRSSDNSKNSSVKSDLSKGSDSNSDHSEKLHSNGLNGNSDHKSQISDDVPSERLSESDKTDKKSDSVKRVNTKKEGLNSNSLTSLGNLPPLTKTAQNNASSKSGTRQQSTIKDLKAILDLESGPNFEEDVLSNSSGKGKNEGLKVEVSISDGSEVEDEVSEVASGLTDDNTVDLSISKESGKGDYLEDL